MRLLGLSQLFRPRALARTDWAAVPSFRAQDRLNEWATAGKPVLVTEIAPLFAQIQKERKLPRPLPLGADEKHFPGLSVQHTRAKMRLYGAVQAVGAKWWALTRPRLEIGKEQLLRRAGMGDFLDADALETEIDALMHAHVAEAFGALTEEQLHTYDTMLHLTRKYALDTSTPRTRVEHFSHGIRTGTSLNFTAVRRTLGLPRVHLKAGSALPPSCRSYARALFRQPFVRQALALPGHLATGHLAISSAATDVLGLSDAFDRLNHRPGTEGHWQLQESLDALHLALSPEGAGHVGRELMARVDGLLKGDRAARLGCPAMQMLDVDPMHPEAKSHVVEYLKKLTLELAQAHVYPVAAEQLRDLHAHAAADAR